MITSPLLRKRDFHVTIGLLQRALFSCGKGVRYGKEIGTGICQRKDGLYTARFLDRTGKRQEKYFKTLPEARNWLEDAKYAERHGEVVLSSEVTVDEWFENWIENNAGGLAPNTRRNYRERYVHNIQPSIGRMLLTDVKPMHCKMVLNRMEAKYAGGTIRRAYITMGAVFRAALMRSFSNTLSVPITAASTP